MPHIEPKYEGKGHRYGVVVARFNLPITEMLLNETCKGLQAHGVDEKDITVAWVPGAFELPLVAKQMAHSDKYDGVICIGAVIRGETAHFDYVSDAATSGILEATLSSEIPVIFSVLTTDNRQQAEYRASPDGKNVGLYGAKAALEMVNLLHQIA